MITKTVKELSGRLVNGIRTFRWGYAFIALVMTAIALLLFIFGFDAIDYLAIAIGVVIIASSAVLLALSIADRRRGVSFGLKLTLCICLLISGIATLIARGTLISVIISIIGLIMIIDGSFKLNTAAMSKRYRAAAWWIMLVLSAITIGGGYFAVRFPEFETKVGYVLLGIVLLVDGAANLLSAFFLGYNEKRSELELEERLQARRNAVPAQDASPDGSDGARAEEEKRDGPDGR